MIGAAAGDIIGSVYEHNPIKTKVFPLFDVMCRITDDTVLTVAVAHAILTGGTYEKSIREIGNQYPDCGYGQTFQKWLNHEETGPYGSWGNGSAMRASPIGFAFSTTEEVLNQAKLSAEISHNHPEGIMGAQAAALAVFLARTGSTKEEIRYEIASLFGYDLDRRTDDIRISYTFDISCRGTVPEAVISFLDSYSFEDAVRNAVSLGGDSDTLACIAGGIAEAYYGVPDSIREQVRFHMSPELWEITEAFYDFIS